MTTQLVIPFTAERNEEHHQHLTKTGMVMPWIQVAEDAPYFITEDGRNWTPIGQNDAITWPELKGLFRRKDSAPAEAYFKMLVQHGVTCLRLMLEYCHNEHRYFEKPIGSFKPAMVRLWDDIFSLCEKYGLRILLTPYDTFWMWLRWPKHPYNRKNGGHCDKRAQWLLCRDTRSAIKERLAFATERWGKSGALFAWDIWNEIHPAHAGDSAEIFQEFIHDISSSLRKTEHRLYGRTHPQTVSVFGPVLYKEPLAVESIFRHPALDFASVHFYESNTIDHPKNTVDAAISAGRLTREAVGHIQNSRPFFDSEHGPIHSFKDKRITLPETFDDEYFLHMQWAHFASGGAGGGMRWPNRSPHSLTTGMRRAQQSLARFLPLIHWKQFRRRNLNNEVISSDKTLAAFCCGDRQQSVLWLLRTNKINKKGTLDRNITPSPALIQIPGLKTGRYRITTWDTASGNSVAVFELHHREQSYLSLPVPAFTTNLALAIRNVEVGAN